MLETRLLASEHCMILRPVGQLDAFTAGQFREAAGSLPDGATVVVDLNDLAFLDSAGLAALVHLIRRVREGQGRVAVAAPSGGPVTRVAMTAGLQRIVPISLTVEGATAALTEPE